MAIKGYTDEQIKKLIEQDQKRKEYNMRRRIEMELYKLKAVEKGITVTEAEIDAEIKRRQRKR